MTQTKRPVLDDWEAEAVRLTFFGNPATFGRATGWWKSLVGKDPDSIQGRPTEGIFQEEGAFGESWRLAVGAAAGRVDIILGPEPAPAWPSVGKAEASLATLVNIAKDRSNLFVDATRVAVGINVSLKVDSREAGYETLAQLLRGVAVTTDMHDLAYQVNYPRPSKVCSAAINRLARWNVSKIMLNTPVPPLVAWDMGQVARVEVDVNTEPAVSLRLNETSLSALLDELSGFAAEIIQDGDVK